MQNKDSSQGHDSSLSQDVPNSAEISNRINSNLPGTSIVVHQFQD